jgi:hypothetical protein
MYFSPKEFYLSLKMDDFKIPTAFLFHYNILNVLS